MAAGAAPEMCCVLARALSAEWGTVRRRLHVKKAVTFDPFEADSRIDPEDSEFKLQHLLIGLEDAVARVHIEAPPRLRLAPRIILGLERAVRRARDFLRGGASCRLLRCIQRVISTTRPGFRQKQLQQVFLRPQVPSKGSKAPVGLPSGMTTPRTLGHAPDRLRHFGRLRAAGDIAKHRPASVTGAGGQELESSSAPLSRVSSDQESFAGVAPSPTPSMSLRTLRRCSSGSSSRTSRLGPAWRNVWPEPPPEPKVSLRCPSVSTATGPTSRTLSRTSAGSAATESRTLSRTSSLAKASADSRKGSRGSVSEMARSVRRLELGGEAREQAIPLEPTAAGQQASGEVCPGHRRSASEVPGSAAGPQEPSKRPYPMPKLEGKTSGFAAKDPLHPCPWLSKPPKGGWPKAARIFTKAERAVRGEGVGLDSDQPDRAQPSHPRLLGKERELGSVKARRSGSLCGAKLASQVSHAGDWESAGMQGLLEVQELRTGRPVEHAKALPLAPCGPGGPVFGEATLQERLWLPEVSYAQGCMREKVAPWLGVKFFSMRLQELNLDNMLLGDGDLQSLLEALQQPHQQQLWLQQQHHRQQPQQRQQHQPPSAQTAEGGHFSAITELNLANNRRLTDGALARFFDGALLGGSLGGQPCLGPLRVLSLASCMGLGTAALESLSKLLAYAAVFEELEELDISNVCIPRTSWPGLAEGLRRPRSLRALRLARTGCGEAAQQPCALVASLLGSCRSLRAVDLSGNYFRHEGCRAVAVGLQAASTELRELDMSHNAGFDSPDQCLPETLRSEGRQGGVEATTPRFNPIMHVLSVLGETNLGRADFANCQLSFQEDCVLEDVVGSSEIVHLNVSDNPHGEEGLRCLVRLLARPRPPWKDSELEHLELGVVRDGPAPDNGPSYDYRDPSARYRLALRKPHHRSLLRLLLKRAEEATGAGGKEFECFGQAELDGQPASLPSLCGKRLDRGGDDWRVPERGILAFQFKFPLFYDPLDDATTVMMKFAQIMSVKVSFKAFSRIKTLYKAVLDTRSRRLLLRAMGRDLCFRLPQVLDLAKETSELYLAAVAALLPAVEEQLPMHKALFDVLDSCKGRAARQQLRQAKVDSHSLIYFNYQHPDGHYSLNLSNKADTGTAQRCIVISNWMKNQSLAKNLLDCSEFGNRESMRSTTLSGKKFRFDSTEWLLPVQGVLSFDFVLPRLRLKEEDAIKDSSLIVLAQMVQDSPCSFRDQLCALRSVAHLLVLTPEQLRRLLEVFPPWGAAGCRCPAAQPRAEAYVSLYNRTLYHSEVVSPKLLYSQRLLHREEAEAIQRRLGWIHTFDLLNCHSPRSNLGNRHGPISMEAHDGWVIVKALVSISLSEKAPHFDDIRWSERQEFYERGYTFVIPSTWVPDPPRVGELSLGVITREEEVNVARRMEVAQQLLGWTFRSSTQPPAPAVRKVMALGAAKARA